MQKIDIYMTSWFRTDFLRKSIALIHERTESGTFNLHVFENESSQQNAYYLVEALNREFLTSVHLDSRNTGCLYNKGVFQSMTESSSKYYVVTDNDVYPPKLSPDWLSQMVEIMDRHPNIAFLTPQLPPQFLQVPSDEYDNEVRYCKAVGNTFKLVRREAYPFDKYEQKIGAYGDDGQVSELVSADGWKVAFCRNIYCWHAGQCENWGYKPDEITKDPRKSGYGKPFTYDIMDEETYIPKDPQLRM